MTVGPADMGSGARAMSHSSSDCFLIQKQTSMLHPKRNVTSGSDYLAIDVWLKAATARSFHVCSLHCWPCALSSAAEAEGKARGPNEGRCRDTQKRDGEINHMKEMNHSRQSSRQITPWHSTSQMPSTEKGHRGCKRAGLSQRRERAFPSLISMIED